MNRTLELTEQEMDVLLELLEAERGDLPAQIHHCDNHDVHRALKERLRTVDTLLENVRQTKTGSPGAPG